MSAVTEYLADHEIEFLAFDHPRALSSIEEARSLGVEADEVAKSIVLDTRSGHIVAVIPASRRLDMRAVRDAVGDRHVALASEAEIERDFPGFELGAVPPLAGLVSVPVVIDPEIARHETVVFASGKQTESVKMRTADLVKAVHVRVEPLTHLEPAADTNRTE